MCSFGCTGRCLLFISHLYRDNSVPGILQSCQRKGEIFKQTKSVGVLPWVSMGPAKSMLNAFQILPKVPGLKSLRSRECADKSWSLAKKQCNRTMMFSVHCCPTICVLFCLRDLPGDDGVMVTWLREKVFRWSGQHGRSWRKIQIEMDSPELFI